MVLHPAHVLPPHACQQRLTYGFELIGRHLVALQFIQLRKNRFSGGQLHFAQRGKGVADGAHDLLQRNGCCNMIDALKLPGHQHRLCHLDHVSLDRRSLRVHGGRTVGSGHSEQLVACLHAPAQQYLFTEPVTIQPCAQFT